MGYHENAIASVIKTHLTLILAAPVLQAPKRHQFSVGHIVQVTETRPVLRNK